jgi:cytochrome c-type protein NapC
MFKLYFTLSALLLLLTPLAGTTLASGTGPQASPGASSEIDWGSINPTPILLIYPGVTSWEFLQSEDHRLGARAIQRGRKSCRHCHLSKEGELDMDVANIVTGSLKMKRSHEPFESEPIPGKPPTLKANLRAAYDNENLYLRVEWPSRGFGWKQQSIVNTPDRVSIQLNGNAPFFKRYGCFISCHTDVASMPKSPSKKSVMANSYYKSLGRDDVRLYAYYAKNAWNSPKPGAELKKVRQEFGPIDLWSVELSAGKSKSLDGAIFTDRLWQKSGKTEGTGEWSDAGYSVTFTRALGPGNSNDIAIEEGSVISIAIAIHDNGTKQRQHYISFPLSIGLGANADLRAKKLK